MTVSKMNQKTDNKSVTNILAHMFKASNTSQTLINPENNDMHNIKIYMEISTEITESEKSKIYSFWLNCSQTYLEKQMHKDANKISKLHWNFEVLILCWYLLFL